MDGRFLSGDLFLVHTEGLLGRTIQAAQRRRFGSITGTIFNHAAGLDCRVPGKPAVIEATWPAVRSLPLRQWWAEWVTGPEVRVAHLRAPGLSPNQRSMIATKAASFVGSPYDGWALVTAGRAYWWWTVCHPYAAFILRHHRGGRGALTCSELAVRASYYAVPGVAQHWRQDWEQPDGRWPVDLASPCGIYESGIWEEMATDFIDYIQRRERNEGRNCG